MFEGRQHHDRQPGKDNSKAHLTSSFLIKSGGGGEGDDNNNNNHLKSKLIFWKHKIYMISMCHVRLPQIQPWCSASFPSHFLWRRLPQVQRPTKRTHDNCTYTTKGVVFFDMRHHYYCYYYQISTELMHVVNFNPEFKALSEIWKSNFVSPTRNIIISNGRSTW